MAFMSRPTKRRSMITNKTALYGYLINISTRGNQRFNYIQMSRECRSLQRRWAAEIDAASIIHVNPAPD